MSASKKFFILLAVVAVVFVAALVAGPATGGGCEASKDWAESLGKRAARRQKRVTAADLKAANTQVEVLGENGIVLLEGATPIEFELGESKDEVRTLELKLVRGTKVLLTLAPPEGARGVSLEGIQLPRGEDGRAGKPVELKVLEEGATLTLWCEEGVDLLDATVLGRRGAVVEVVGPQAE